MLIPVDIDERLNTTEKSEQKNIETIKTTSQNQQNQNNYPQQVNINTTQNQNSPTSLQTDTKVSKLIIIPVQSSKRCS